MTIVVFLLDFFSYYLINMVSLGQNVPLVAVCSTIFGAISLIVVYYWLASTRSDPSDPTIRAQRICEAKFERFDGTNYDFMCEICDTHVLSSAKHCGACNRCVSEFDHHCRWINNCVGGKNYTQFFRLIVAAFFMTLMHNITDGFVVYLFLVEDTFVTD